MFWVRKPPPRPPLRPLLMPPRWVLLGEAPPYTRPWVPAVPTIGVSGKAGGMGNGSAATARGWDRLGG